jgi:hypothetical protein
MSEGEGDELQARVARLEIAVASLIRAIEELTPHVPVMAGMRAHAATAHALALLHGDITLD